MSDENKNENGKNIQNPNPDDKNKAKEEANKKGGNKNEDWKNDDRLDENGNLKEVNDSAKAKDEAKVKAAKKEESTKGVQSATQQIENFIEDAGLKPKEVAQIVSENDGITPEIMKALVEKHGEAVAGLIADRIAGLHKTSKSAAKERDTALFDQVKEAFTDEQSGEDSFKELSTWAKTNIDNKDRVEINAMLAKGGLAAKLAMQELITTFKESEDYTQSAKLVIGDNVSDVSGGQELDRKAYQKELRKLQKSGHVYGESEAMKALDRRRMKAINRR